ncbi:MULTISPECIES: hypothetical protein [Paenibacillus]|uniref:Uncharacterized protein n=1 Tax=Paenibacillus odorifer TaxID=189426 RepID=A0ABX3HXG0_9BACL|nr:hypothetical protein [Paenibacillus odorifer]OMD55277.1 hypothetical protein BSK51_04280 [Paenibacillus odorifer]
MDKVSFSYEYARPCMDWYEWIRKEIKPDDYYYFRIERRFGPSWWLIGMKPVKKPSYHWKDEDISEIKEPDLKRFIEWAKTERGSRIIEVKAISSDFNIIEEIANLIGRQATVTTE